MESLLDKPHALGPLEVQLRSVVQRRWSSCKKRNQYGQLKAPEPEWRTGKTGVMKVAPQKVGTVGEPDSYVPKLNEMQLAQESLAKRLKSFGRDHPAAQWLSDTADRMQPVDVSEFTENLLQQAPDMSEDMLKQPFPDGYKPPVTEWLPRKRQQHSPPRGFRPTKLEDLLLPHAVQRINKWLKLAVEDLKRMQLYGRDAGRRHNAVEALGQDCLVPAARGIVWDLRRVCRGNSSATGL